MGCSGRTAAPTAAAQTQSRVPCQAELVICDKTIERTLGWLSTCRALLIRWDKHASNYLGLLKLACALLWFRRYYHLAGLR
jgi:transposase